MSVLLENTCTPLVKFKQNYMYMYTWSGIFSIFLTSEDINDIISHLYMVVYVQMVIFFSTIKRKLHCGLKV